MENMIEENHRSEYPADRIVMDIFELIQAMSMIAFRHSIYWSRLTDGDSTLSVGVWDENSQVNLTIEYATYNETETDSLNGLYERLWEVYKKVNPIPADDPLPF